MALYALIIEAECGPFSVIGLRHWKLYWSAMQRIPFEGKSLKNPPDHLIDSFIHRCKNIGMPQIPSQCGFGGPRQQKTVGLEPLSAGSSGGGGGKPSGVRTVVSMAAEQAKPSSVKKQHVFAMGESLGSPMLYYAKSLGALHHTDRWDLQVGHYTIFHWLTWCGIELA